VKKQLKLQEKMSTLLAACELYFNRQFPVFCENFDSDKNLSDF